MGNCQRESGDWVRRKETVISNFYNLYDPKNVEVIKWYEDLAREARRAAKRYGWVIRKSRRDIDKGMYAIFDAHTGNVVFGMNVYSGWWEADLDDVEGFLKD